MKHSASIERFGPYNLLHRIARGGMAEVFVARPVDASEPGLVVIKRLHRELSRDREFVRMFQDEERLIARLNHPGIIRVDHFGEHDGRYYIVLEHVWGESMTSLTQMCAARGMRFPLGAALYVGAQVAEALRHAHELCDESGAPSPVIHRDVTLGNVIIGYDGEVKVLDFGIAKAADRLAQTRAGQIKGTLVYLAPEQLRGQEIGPATDIYQLGVLLYKTLLGREPFRGKSEVEVMEHIVTGHMIKPSLLVPNLPSTIEGLLLKAMARKPERRFESMAQMVVVLRALLGDAYAAGRQRLREVVVQITGDRQQRQQHFIDSLIDGKKLDEPAEPLFATAEQKQEPQTLAVELSAIVDAVADPSLEGDTLVSPRPSHADMEFLTRNESRPPGISAVSTTQVGASDFLDVFNSTPDPESTAASVFESVDVLTNLTRPNLPSFLRMLEAEAEHGDELGAFEKQSPETVPLDELIRSGRAPAEAVALARHNETGREDGDTFRNTKQTIQAAKAKRELRLQNPAKPRAKSTSTQQKRPAIPLGEPDSVFEDAPEVDLDFDEPLDDPVSDDSFDIDLSDFDDP